VCVQTTAEVETTWWEAQWVGTQRERFYAVCEWCQCRCRVNWQ